MKVPADGYPERAEEAVQGAPGECWDEAVAESAGEGLLR